MGHVVICEASTALLVTVCLLTETISRVLSRGAPYEIRGRQEQPPPHFVTRMQT